MGHHNTSVRQDALLGLRDIFESHPDVLPKHLPKLVEQVFITVVDSSSAVRQASHLLMETLLSSVGNNVVSPFFETLIAHLSCGLTHIKEKIQLDSLKVLELYLKHCSSLVEAHVGDLVLVLIGLLSRQKSLSAHSSAMSKAQKGRSLIGIVGNAGSTTLVNNPSSTLLNKASRLRILKLISSLLELLLETAPRSSLQMSPHNVRLDDGGGFVEVSGALLSIVVEAWVESHPGDAFHGKGYPVQSLCVMETVINILCVLLKLMLRLTRDSEGKQEGKLQVVDWYKKIVSDISCHMVCHFPFRTASTSTATQKHFQHLYVMNFTFCEMALLLWELLSPVKAGMTEELTLATMQYLSSLGSSDITSSVQNSTCSRIVTNLAPSLYALSLTRPETECALIGGTFTFVRDFYVACHPHSRSKRLLVQCFCAMFVKELERGECK